MTLCPRWRSSPVCKFTSKVPKRTIEDEELADIRTSRGRSLASFGRSSDVGSLVPGFPAGDVAQRQSHATQVKIFFETFESESIYGAKKQQAGTCNRASWERVNDSRPIDFAPVLHAFRKEHDAGGLPCRALRPIQKLKIQGSTGLPVTILNTTQNISRSATWYHGRGYANVSEGSSLEYFTLRDRMSHEKK